MLIDNLTRSVAALESSDMLTFGRYQTAQPVASAEAPIGADHAAFASYLHALYLSILGRHSDSDPACTLLRPLYSTKAQQALRALMSSTDPEAREFATHADGVDYTVKSGISISTLFRLASRLELGKSGDYSVLHLVAIALGDEAHTADDVTVPICDLNGDLYDSTLGLTTVKSGGVMMDLPPYWRLLWGLFLHDQSMSYGGGTTDTVLRFIGATALPLNPFAVVAERRSGQIRIPFANYVSLLMREMQMFGAETRRMVTYRSVRDFATMTRLRFFGCQDHAIDDEGYALGFLSALSDRGSRLEDGSLFSVLVNGHGLLTTRKGGTILVLPEDIYTPAFEAITLTEGEAGSEDDPFGTGDDNDPPVDPTGKTPASPITTGEGDTPTPEGDTGTDGEAGGGDPTETPDETGDVDSGFGDTSPSEDQGAPGEDPTIPNNNNMSLLIPPAGQGENADDYYYRIAVLNVREALEKDPDSEFDPDKFETLNTVCNNWLFQMDIASVKQLVEDLGLKTLLGPLVEK